MTSLLNQELIDFLVKKASEHCVTDDKEWYIYDYTGGNIDEAYFTGVDDGEVLYARFILDKLGINYK